MDLATVEKEIDANGFCVLSAIECDVAAKAKLEYLELKSSTTLHSQMDAMDKSTLKENPFRKTAIGSVNGLGEKISQILQTTYFDNEAHYCEHLSFCARKLVGIRNRLMNLAEDFGSNSKRDGYWNASRVHHYPSGGGHMQGHCDRHFPALLNGETNKFVQVAMSLSKRGNDFKSGGFFVRNRHGVSIDIEEMLDIGSILCFDGRLEHGILDVDSHQVLDWDSESGRLALFSMLYENFEN